MNCVFVSAANRFIKQEVPPEPNTSCVIFYKQVVQMEL
jgi:hypothetical protein